MCIRDSGKIHEVEHENVGVEGGHKGEELVEHQTAKAIRSGIRHHKMKPYKAVERAERESVSYTHLDVYKRQE